MSLREHVSLREHACVSSRGAQSTELVWILDFKQILLLLLSYKNNGVHNPNISIVDEIIIYILSLNKMPPLILKQYVGTSLFLASLINPSITKVYFLMSENVKVSICDEKLLITIPPFYRIKFYKEKTVYILLKPVTFYNYDNEFGFPTNSQ